MKKIIGKIVMFIGICAGLYTGLWICFAGGIIDVITEVRAEEMDAGNLTFGIIKVVLAGFVGWITALLFTIIGAKIESL